MEVDLAPVDARGLAQRAMEAEQDFLSDVFLRRGNQENRIREVRSFA
jgi:hypothetical protein